MKTYIYIYLHCFHFIWVFRPSRLTTRELTKVEHLLQAVKSFDKYKAIAYEFNKLSGRPGNGKPFGKGIIEFKLKSLEMEGKGS